MLNAKPMRQESGSDLQALLDAFRENILCSTALGCQPDNWNDMLVVILEDKLDSSARHEWVKSHPGNDLPKFEDLVSCLSSHACALLASGASSHPRRERFIKANNANTTHKVQCKICNQGKHYHFQCKQFIQLSPEDRMSKVRALRLCFNCLSSDHTSRSCASTRRCTVCKNAHHTLLHLTSRSGDPPPQQDQGQKNHKTPAASNAEGAENLDKEQGSKVGTNHVDLHCEVVLKTAVVNVSDVFRNQHQGRLFIDGGSQGDFVSEALVARLKLPRTRARVTVTGFGDTPIGKCKGVVRLNLTNRNDPDQAITVYAHVLPKLPSLFPSTEVTSFQGTHIQGLELADPKWNIPGKVDIVLGMRYFGKVMKEEKRLLGNGQLGAYNSIFGWIVAGPVSAKSANMVRMFNTNISPDLEFLHRFWEVENLPPQKLLTKDEKEFERYFVRTVKRDDTGRFHVSIPFNGKQHQLGLTKDTAYRRWIQVEKRLQRNPQYLQQYNAFMEEYLQLGHMEEIPEGECIEHSGKTNYLPHHFVTNEDSSTTKLRVVFDGSAKSTSGLSLNDCMMVGATQQDDLFDLLLRFRLHPVALKADIAKMFRQFRLGRDDSNFHRILWRPAPTHQLKEYRLTTITYGTACATNLSTRCLVQLAEDNKDKFPEASKALRESMFVDDLLGGEASSSAASRLVRDLNAVAASAGLELRKWCTNDPDVLASIPDQLREMDMQSFQEENDVKTLGVRWNPTSDQFGFSTYVFSDAPIMTMRVLLSNLARVFDPLGFIAPVTVRAKLLYQELWRLKLAWDDPVPDAVAEQWKMYEEDLRKLVSFRIPRRVTFNNVLRIELHGFSDASERALGGVVYIRSILEDGIGITFVTSKTKVAPVKQVSLPRLELEAALLTAKLVNRVASCLQLTECSSFLWSDSTITLTWISASPRRWTTFVANRVAKIQELTQMADWRHVPGIDNPADLASRGISVDELLSSDKWLKGPKWLSEQILPIFTAKSQPHIDMEERKTFQAKIVNTRNDTLERFSSLKRLLKVTAWILRYKNMVNMRISGECTVGEDMDRQSTSSTLLVLRVDEIEEAFRVWVRVSQNHYFNMEINDLMKNGRVASNSSLRSLHPYLDKQGILRVAGRLENADFPDAAKHPIILDGRSYFVKLLVWDAHHSLLHAGFTQVWSNLNSRFWILRGRDIVKGILHNCRRCFRYRATAAQQLMGQLPVARVTKSRPFLHVGVDYAGPFTLKNPVGRAPKTYKGYLCVFICMATKATHLEAVSSLSTEGFLDALRRFTSRRGLCRNVYSDCGTNFVGADKELQKFMKDERNQQRLAEGVLEIPAVWHFNSPSAPHHGGLWEAAVKSCKYHLRRVVGNSCLTYEAFSTILCQIEGILNSRPLTPVSDDPSDYDVLTPGHFLIGDPLVAIPERNVEDVPINRLTKFQQQQQRVQHFWKRWRNEYLHTLQQRFKWRWEKEDVQVGEMVLLIEDTSPGHWEMGRIIQLHPGRDGHVRVVTVKTATRTLERPIVKLAPLPKEN